MTVNRNQVNVTPDKTTVTGDAAGFVKYPTDTSAGYVVQAQVQTDDLANTAVTTDKVTDAAITPVKLQTTGATSGVLHYPDAGTIASGLTIGQVQTADIADSAITSSLLADNSVTSSKFGNGSVTTAKLENNCVTESKLASSAVTRSRIQWGSRLASYKPEGYSNGGVVVRYQNAGNLQYTDGLDGSIITDGTLDTSAFVTDLKNLIEGLPAIEFGQSNSVSVPGNSSATVEVTFTATKTEAPLVFATLQTANSGTQVSVTCQSVTNAQASFIVSNLTSTDITDGTLDWLAISGR